MILLVSCDCGIDESELLLTSSELSFFDSYIEGDTIIYLGDMGSSDTLIVDTVTPTVEEFDINCGFLSSEPRNEKSIFIRHLPRNIYPFTPLETSESATIKSPQWLFSFQVVANPRDVNMVINFKNFSFASNQFEDYRTVKDTVFTDIEVDEFYKLPHTENGLDEIVECVYWIPTEGMLAYTATTGEHFSRID